MRNSKNRLKSENGAISTVVLVTILFFLTILSSAYMITATIRKGQLKSELVTKDTYESELDNVEEIYANQFIKISELKRSGEAVNKNTKAIDEYRNFVTVPEGFKIASESGNTVNDGIVIEDKEGNQFVWIPVDSINDYTRTSFSGENITSEFTETLPNDEKTSIEKYHGYYIGRFEAGDSVSTAAKTLRTGSTSKTNKVSVKKGQAPYNNVTREQAKNLAEGMDTAQGYNATTKLCSSYAWDTAIRFIQRKNSDYGRSSKEGNYNNTTFTYTNIAGASQTKIVNTNILVPTGNTTVTNNIYDMGGNVWEWTSEDSSNNSNPHTIRGGGFDNNYTVYAAGFRHYYFTTAAYDSVGFRLTLIM